MSKVVLTVGPEHTLRGVLSVRDILRVWSETRTPAPAQTTASA